MLTGSSQSASRRRSAARVVARRGPSPVRPRPTARPPERAFTGGAALRLVGQGTFAGEGQRSDQQAPIQGMHDPRWVLAVRVAEKLEGPILRPEHRQQLVRLGRMLGLSVFDCNLVIAIVQDQARRGHEPAYCPTAGEEQLRLIPLPVRATFLTSLRHRPALLVAGILGTLLLLELMLLQWLF